MTLIALGIAVSTWLAIAHYTEPKLLACPDTGVINCAKVTTSSYSVLLGIPLPIFGLIFFLGMLLFNLPAAWRSRDPWIRRLRLTGATLGVLMVFYLVYTELFRLDALCLYCTATHIITVLLFIVTMLGTALTAE